MSKSNGHADLPWPSVDFRIGGRDLAVPAIGFMDMDELDGFIRALGPQQSTREYVTNVMHILAHLLAHEQPGLTAEGLTRRLLAGEVNGFVMATTELLRASGFTIPAATPVPENPGTGTSTGSVPGLPSEESAPAIPSS